MTTNEDNDYFFLLKKFQNHNIKRIEVTPKKDHLSSD